MQWDADICDTAIFEPKEFAKAISKIKSPLIVYKDYLQNCNQYLIEEFDTSKPVKNLLYKRAWFIDELLTQAWQQHLEDSGLCLVAVGGYGRGELHPASDVDILILGDSKISKDTKKAIESYLVFLWDIGLEIGHSVRTIKECRTESKADITIATNLMEARVITGDEKLFTAMQEATGPKNIWSPRKFFEAKWQEQQERHNKYDGSEQNLEPNVKEGPGALRDIQVIDWVAKRYFDASRLSQLVDVGFLTQEEYNTLAEGRELLWQVRFALHILNGRREDRLLFDYQRAVAKYFGYESEDNSAVEQFMRRYYKTVKELNRLNEILLQHFQEAIIYANRKEKIRPLNKRFQIRNDFIEVCDKNTFKRYPIALLEIFLLIQQNPKIKGVRASTIRLLRDSTDLIDDEFRNDIRNNSLFMEIIKQPRRVGHELRRMHRYGVLSAYMPEFSRIDGLMQFDLFHVYTVDEHILFVVQNMRLFNNESSQDLFPYCKHILRDIPKLELLYLSGIFHDIAKGRGGNHSELGEQDAVDFCKSHGLPDFDCKLVGWLVKNHLFMSITAQRKDITDPDVIQQFAERVGDIMHLRYLYLLTVADICGTNPKMWNSWKASLLEELFRNTERALRRGLENPIDKSQRIDEIKNQVRDLLGKSMLHGKSLESLWEPLGEDYFIRYSAEEIAWQTRAMARASEDDVTVSMLSKTSRGGTAIFIYMKDHDNIFSRITAALDNLCLTIVDARIITSFHGYTLDTFIVLDASGEVVKDRGRLKEIKQNLENVLTSLGDPARPSSRMESRILKNFPIPTQVNFSQDENKGHTIMEVIATDRVGFLAKIGIAMKKSKAKILNAKIATYGERVEDIFFISDMSGNMIKEEKNLERLKNKIIDQLENH
jgi:[protein-PII] uridylyltransferase